MALTLAGLPQAAAAACGVEEADLQPVICSSAGLSDAWGRIDATLATLSTAHPELAAPLQQDQALFTTMIAKTLQDLQAEHTAAEVPEILLTGLEDRLAFLDAIAPAEGSGLTGSWQNAAGYLRVSEGTEGQLRVQLSVMEPVMGLSTCSAEGTGKAMGSLVNLALPPAEEISVSQGGHSGLAGVDVTRAGRAVQGPAGCETSPPVAGWYFRVNDGG